MNLVGKMVMLRQRLNGPWVALLLLGCSSNNSSTSTPEAQTLIGIEPQDFVAAGACGSKLELYVGTLWDVTGPERVLAAGSEGVAWSRFAVASSPPTACTDSIVFANVIPYHAYEVEIEGYDRADIEPLAAGTSAMSIGGEYVAPTYSALCRGWTAVDGGSEPGMSYPYITVVLRNCSKLGQ